MLAMCQGRQEEAVELLKQELVLDPLRPLEYMYLAQNLRDLGRYQEAHVALGKALDLNPNQMMIYEIRGEVYLAQGRPQEALAEMEKEPEGWPRSWQGACLPRAWTASRIRRSPGTSDVTTSG